MAAKNFLVSREGVAEAVTSVQSRFGFRHIIAQDKNLSKIKGLVQANPFSLRVFPIVSVQSIIKVEL